MTDIPVGRELWGDLLRQIARRTRNRSDAEDLLHSAYLRLERYRSQNVVNDPAVVGGMSVQIGDELVDGTAASRLAEVRRKLAS